MGSNLALDIINTASSVLGIVIPIYLEKTSRAYKRAEEIWGFLELKIQTLINEKWEKFENLNDSDLVKYFNSIKILNEAFLDLDVENPLKKKLLNFEINKIFFSENSYKYCFNKVNTDDLNLLKILCEAEKVFIKSKKLISLLKDKEIITWIPTYAALESDDIIFRDSLEKTFSGNVLISTHLFNAYIYNGGNSEKLLLKYNKYKQNFINLINLMFIIPKEDIALPSSDYDSFSDFYPFAFKITDKGREIYKLLDE